MLEAVFGHERSKSVVGGRVLQCDQGHFTTFCTLRSIKQLMSDLISLDAELDESFLFKLVSICFQCLEVTGHFNVGDHFSQRSVAHFGHAMYDSKHAQLQTFKPSNV